MKTQVSTEDMLNSEKEKDKGNEYIKIPDYENALKCYNTAIALNPENPLLYSNRSLVWLKKNQFEKAISDCNKALILKSDHLKANQRRGKAYFELGNYEKAQIDLRKVVELEPNNLESYEDLKICNQKLIEKKIQRQEMNKKAKREQTEVLESVRETVFVDEDLYFYDTENYIEKSLRNAEIALKKGMEIANRAEYIKAIEEYDKVLEMLINLSPKRTEKINGLKAAICAEIGKLYMKLLQFEKCIEILDLTIEICGKADKDKARPYLIRTFAFEHIMEYDNALNDVKEYLKLNPNDNQALEILEKLNYLVNKVRPKMPFKSQEQAKKFLEDLERQKENANKVFKLQNYNSSIEEFTQIINRVKKQYSDSALLNEATVLKFLLVIYNNRAIVYQKTGSIDSAVEDCLQVLRLDHSNSKALYRIAKCFEANEMYKDARRIMQKVIQIDSNNLSAINDLKLYQEKLSQMPDFILTNIESKEEEKKVEKTFSINPSQPRPPSPLPEIPKNLEKFVNAPKDQKGPLNNEKKNYASNNTSSEPQSIPPVHSESQYASNSIKSNKKAHKIYQDSTELAKRYSSSHSFVNTPQNFIINLKSLMKNNTNIYPYLKVFHK